MMERAATTEQPKIQSLLWLDLYKLTMGNLVFQEYPEVEAKYEFINRGKTKFPRGFDEKIRHQVNLMGNLQLKPQEEDYLREKCTYLSSEYVDWLTDFRLNPEEVKIEQEDGNLKIEVEGPWKSSIFWETHIMELICESYYEETGQKPTKDYILEARRKGELYRRAQARILEFGTRRAYSTRVHREVLQELIESAGVAGKDEGGVLLGTSNVALAMELNLDPSGTFAHEWVMAHAGIFGVQNANNKAMKLWTKHYGKYPRLMTTLTDTYTTDVFLHGLNRETADQFSNFRQDSGNPFVEGLKLVNGLRVLGIDPRKKGIVFSDNLNTQRILELNERFRNITTPLFGVGTHLTNDVGVTPLNIVLKLYSIIINGIEIGVAKLSDEEGKSSGEKSAIEESYRHRRSITRS